MDFKNAVDALRPVYQKSIFCEDECANTDAAWEKVEARIKPKALSINERQPQIQQWWAIAASILAVAGLALTLYLIAFNQPETLMLTAGPGNLEAFLPDGSVVTLREGSTLSYPENFGSKERNVALSGEAFFDVAKNANVPFIVAAENANVTVLGTSFFVKALKSDSMVSVLVKSGKVSLASNEAKTTAVTLDPGEKGDLNTRSKAIKKSEAIVSAMDFWLSKTIRFRKTDLNKVAEILTRFFGKEITLENQALASCRITATFKDEGLVTILEVISATLNLEVREEGGVIILSGEGC